MARPTAPERSASDASARPRVARITARAPLRRPSPELERPDAPGEEAEARTRSPATTRRAVLAGPTAGRERPARGRPAQPPDRLEQLVAAARASLDDDKAENIVVLDTLGRSDSFDRLLIATGQVERQLQAMASHVVDALGKAGRPLRRNDIQASPDWVLIDAGDLIVHLFRPEARDSYALERMWGPDSPRSESAIADAARAAGAETEAETETEADVAELPEAEDAS